MGYAKRLGDLALSETGFVFDPFTGSTFTVNKTGLCVLQALREGLSEEAVRERVKERFDARGVDVARDVDDFIASLRQHGILSEDEQA